MYPALVLLARFTRDGRFEMFCSLGGQESELLCLPNSVEQWDPILQQYLSLRLKFLHVALSELEDAIFGSLRIVRCRSSGICQVLG